MRIDTSSGRLVAGAIAGTHAEPSDKISPAKASKLRFVTSRRLLVADLYSALRWSSHVTHVPHSCRFASSMLLPGSARPPSCGCTGLNARLGE